MSSTAEQQHTWTAPNVTTDARGVINIDFRDCVVEIEQGLVCRYVDKMHNVHLRPSDDVDNWAVYTDAGDSTGQTWRGIIAFDGAQLLIQQARNSLFRLYRTDGTIETQLRMTRVIERPGLRQIFYPHGDYIEEEIGTGVRRACWGDRTVVRDAEGEAVVYDTDGNILESPVTIAQGEAVGGELLGAFIRSLALWQNFAPPEDGIEFFFGGPPGFIEAAPGEAFTMPVEGKPDDIREPISHNFEDGTILHEYLGRLNGVPFMGHELITHHGLVLARMIEYDQPKQITFCDPRGLIREFPEVRMVEMQFDPQRADYVTCITSASGEEFIHPKGAKFEREG
jgi:hypothetical protein